MAVAQELRRGHKYLRDVCLVARCDSISCERPVPQEVQYLGSALKSCRIALGLLRSHRSDTTRNTPDLTKRLHSQPIYPRFLTRASCIILPFQPAYCNAAFKTVP